MIINAVGCPYSGTGILKIMLEQFGIRTRNGISDLIHERRLVDRRTPYDCYEIPDWISQWIEKFEMAGLNDYMKLGGNFYHDSWGRACAMRVLEEKYQDVRFLIMIRDPRRIIGDWYHTEVKSGPEITMDTYGRTVFKLYSFMWEQADLMKQKPIVMDYELFLGGQYIRFIFDTFKIENSLENIHKAQKIINENKLTKFDAYDGNVHDIVFFQDKLKQWAVA